MLSRFFVISVVFLLVIASGCSTVSTLAIQTENERVIEIPMPEYLILIDGIWARYKEGSILIDSENLGSDIDASEYLHQVYGNSEATYHQAKTQKELLRKDALGIKDKSTDSMAMYIIDHKYGYELVVFGYKGSNQVTFVTGKGVPVAPILELF